MLTEIEWLGLKIILDRAPMLHSELGFVSGVMEKLRPKPQDAQEAPVEAPSAPVGEGPAPSKAPAENEG
jgi:hypothetical protein